MASTCSSNVSSVVSSTKAPSGLRRGECTQALVSGVAFREALGLVSDFGDRGIADTLVEKAALRPLLEPGSHEHLYLGVREDDRAHVPPFCDQRPAVCGFALTLQQPVSNEREARER